jgi:hypothetical protein
MLLTCGACTRISIQAAASSAASRLLPPAICRASTASTAGTPTTTTASSRPTAAGTGTDALPSTGGLARPSSKRPAYHLLAPAGCGAGHGWRSCPACNVGSGFIGGAEGVVDSYARQPLPPVGCTRRLWMRDHRPPPAASAPGRVRGAGSGPASRPEPGRRWGWGGVCGGRRSGVARRACGRGRGP